MGGSTGRSHGGWRFFDMGAQRAYDPLVDLCLPLTSLVIYASFRAQEWVWWGGVVGRIGAHLPPWAGAAATLVFSVSHIYASVMARRPPSPWLREHLTAACWTAVACVPPMCVFTPQPGGSAWTLTALVGALFFDLALGRWPVGQPGS